MRTPKYLVSLHIRVCWIRIVVGSILIHICIWFYGVEWVNFCSVGAKPRVSAIFGYFGGDIKSTFLLSRLNIIVFWIAQLMRGITIYRLYHFPASFDGLY